VPVRSSSGEEIFPTRFVSKNTGKPGYAPACSNKFVQGVCELPKVKCGQCQNQAFIPVNDQAILGHLKGRPDYYNQGSGGTCTT